jgi:PAS domain S-box-containing protein
MSPSASHHEVSPVVAKNHHTRDSVELLDDAPVAVHSIDASGTILWANRAELALLGYPADEYVGQSIAKFHVDPEVSGDLLARLGRGEDLRDREVQLRARDGSIRHVLISSNAPGTSPGGRQLAARCFVHDITDRKRAETEREQRITELARTVRLNDTFAGIVGHDLRGPLSTIVLAGQLLLGYVTEPKGIRTIERVLSSADRMQRMIGQLLDFARARADGGIELERRPIAVSDVARDVIEEVRFARPDWQIELDVQGDVRGDFDANRLSQVFSNLIGNSVQHGSPEAPLVVRIDGRSTAAIHVEVCNRGTIPPQLLPILFAPFRGSHQKQLRSQGLGLGLFITDQIVRAHGGEISAESIEGETAFRFHLPRRASGTTRVATFDTAAPGPGSSSDRIPVPSAASTAPETGLAIDGSARRRTHDPVSQQEERFQILVESVKDYAIFMLDSRGHVASWNTGAQRIKGYTAQEIIGQHFSVFYPESDNRMGKTEYELQAATRDGRFEDEGWRVRKDGSRFWANVVITALRDSAGTLIGFAKITRDLTERRKAEEERLVLAHAQEAVRLRDEFLSLASHELKTPLTVLQLQLDALRDRISTDDRTTLAKLERSHRAGVRLAELVEALLDVSRIATGRFALRFEQGDAADIVAIAVDRLHEAAAVAGCTLSITTDPAIGIWDRSRLDQIVTNLVSNAIRYAAGSPISVSVACREGEAVIAVRDRGPGLPEGQLARVFERFQRAASMRHYGGLGLGLYVVRQLTEAHGGSVTAENPAGGGACFIVRLPVRSVDSELVA